MYVLYVEILFSVILILKAIKRVKGDKGLGNFCFKSKWSSGQALLVVLSVCLYLAYVVIGANHGIFGARLYAVSCILPVIWILYLMVPPAVYEHGIKYFDGYILKSDIERIEETHAGEYKIIPRARSRGSFSIVGLRVKLDKDMNLPFHDQ